MADVPEDFENEFDTETFGPSSSSGPSNSSSSGPSTGNGRPEIEIRVGEMQRAVDEAEAALIAAQPSSPVEKKVFRRGDRIVSIAIDKAPDHRGRIVESQVIVEVGEYALAERLATAATFLKWDSRMRGGGGLKQVNPPKDVVNTLIERGYSLKLPVVVGVVNCPQIMVGGRILDKAGYDAQTGMFFDPRGATFLAIAESPTWADVMTGKDRLLLLFHTFDFKNDTDRAVAMSLILTRLARLAMATAPLHAFDAPVAGSGKSMIVDIAAILATGETAPVFAQGPTLEEFEKRFSVQLMAGRQIIAIDNINNELDGDLLNQSLTQGNVDLRILGQSRKVTVRSSTVTTATGNNLKLVGDLTRRAVIARLDPETDRPEIRQFDCDPLTDARENRAELVAAALTILKAYCVAGMPNRPPRLQGFTEWSDLARGALMWIGLGDPAATQDRLRENDPKLTRLIRVATVWRKAFGTYATTVAEAVAKAEEKKRVEMSWDFKTEPVHPDLNDAFLAVARRGAAINPEALCKYLSSEAERVVALETGAKVRFQKEGMRQGVALWTLVAAGAGEDEVPFGCAT
jgi:putative DNA primase/helicase